MSRTKAITILRGKNLQRLALLRAHRHHRKLISYNKLKGHSSSFDEPSFRRWCNHPHAEKIPKGSLPVYVGQHEKRFIIPMAYLSMPDFQRLMEIAAEEYGFEQKGGLKIPCSEDDFEKILLKCSEYHKSTSKCRRRNRNEISNLQPSKA